MRIYSPMCDWLTLTAWESAQPLASFFYRHTEEINRQGVRRLQYTGQEANGLFLGTARQREHREDDFMREHTMFQASGEIADLAFQHLDQKDIRCTRLDLQATIPLPAGYNARLLYDILTDDQAEWGGRARNVQLVESGDRLDTVYIGARSSDLWIRIYVKADGKGVPAYLRFEVEYKGQKADAVRGAILDVKRTVRSVLAFELRRLPSAQDWPLMSFWGMLGAPGGRITPETVESENSTITWLLRQVEPAVLRLLHGHEHGDRMSAILRRWLREAN